MIYKHHRYADFFPMMGDDDFNNLVRDIKENGFDERMPVIIYEGKILDGRNRDKAANKAGARAFYSNFDGNAQDAFNFVIRHNLNRRHLTSSQKAFIAVELLPELEALAKARQVESKIGNNNANKTSVEKIPPLNIEPSPKARDEAAKLTGTNPRYVSDAKKIKETAPELVNEVKKGFLKISDAKEIAKKPSAERAEIVEKLKSNPEKSLKEILKKETYSEITKKIIQQDIKPQSEKNEIESKERNIKQGDVFLINGKHKLIIADANNIDFVKKHAGTIDCVITDPPYGVNYKSPAGNGLASRGDYEVIENDNEDFNPDILFKYSDNILTWGGNHYANKLPNSAGWIVWDKRDGEQINNNSDCELAWSNMIDSARLFHHKWNGFVKDSEHGLARIHPTQKPVKLFKYCLEITRAGDNVLDLYAGSGSLLLACEETNRRAVLVELSEVYAAAMLNRFETMGYEICQISSEI